MARLCRWTIYSSLGGLRAAEAITREGERLAAKLGVLSVSTVMVATISVQNSMPQKPTYDSRNFVRTEAAPASETPEDSYNASLYRADAKGVGCVRLYVCDVELNGVRTTMELDTGAASSVISEQQFSLIRKGHRNLVLSKDGLPKLKMYSSACLHPTGW